MRKEIKNKMTLQSLASKLIEAMKAKDVLRVSVIRLLISGVKNREIELRPLNKALDEDEIRGVIQKQIAQRKDSIENFKTGNRKDLVDKESVELEILEEFLNEK